MFLPPDHGGGLFAASGPERKNRSELNEIIWFPGVPGARYPLHLSAEDKLPQINQNGTPPGRPCAGRRDNSRRSGVRGAGFRLYPLTRARHGRTIPHNYILIDLAGAVDPFRASVYDTVNDAAGIKG